ncbi:hypothetical protein CPB84DRAFT_1745899 [Gymnopilus junonius]|uniref:Protein kinase domain-containing protein n=1 Tax=Gymnopilus junonius TaxID=109634 RepID=A0A9P5NRI8_GYMJU|nr:hypothetical protein CPB84DRAFT_1745899 [Gymnopilus junonius]
MAWTENWVYDKFSNLQGTTIPRFYGTFMIRLPNSKEDIFAVAMSYIEGAGKLKDRFIDLGSMDNFGQKWYSLAREIFSKVYDFHQMGLCGIDINSGNILVVDKPSSSRENPNPFSVNFIDFATARPSSFPSDEENEKHCINYVMKEDVLSIDELLISMCETPRHMEYQWVRRRWGFYTWMEREHPDDAWFQAWWEKYLKPREDLYDRIAQRHNKRRKEMKARIAMIAQGKKERASGMERVVARLKEAKKLKMIKKWERIDRHSALNEAIEIIGRDKVRNILAKDIARGWMQHFTERYLRKTHKIWEMKRRKREKARKNSPIYQIRNFFSL